jgi:outer membrane protein OmpA-like peptidoglycan-associated protein
MAKLTMTAVAMLAGVSMAGCATEKYVNQHVATVQGQVTTLQGQQQDTTAKVGQLDQTTQDALQRATAAGKLAEGKFVYSMVMSDDSAHFPISSSELSQEETARLDDFANKLKGDNRNVYLEIQGYTDATGSQAGNLRLGGDRAEAVRRYLSKAGVALNRMSTISYGQDDPVAPNKTRAGRAQNRRVVVVVLE